ncbi:hypothetical protein CFIMG_006121RA [Ceratocystis fimbriata CBS 114723]|uniref:Uncharacterized protein n=1 Tax=Ceratocystis fimbriata CBS 114723 TaxID=1035309 RepID=A0A2C5W9Z5_9PEZI|nr:hypothetical protein CFIMG_006121RA [Ceratocystis fimbriata CBS 114723]
MQPTRPEYQSRSAYHSDSRPHDSFHDLPDHHQALQHSHHEHSYYHQTPLQHHQQAPSHNHHKTQFHPSLKAKNNDPRNSVDFLTGRDTATARANSSASAISTENSHSPSVSPRYNLSSVNHSSTSYFPTAESQAIAHAGEHSKSHTNSVSLPSCKNLLDKVDKSMSFSAPRPGYSHGDSIPPSSYGHPHAAAAPRYSYPPSAPDSSFVAANCPQAGKYVSFGQSLPPDHPKHPMYHRYREQNQQQQGQRQYHQTAHYQYQKHPYHNNGVAHPPNFSQPSYAASGAPPSQRQHSHSREQRGSKPRYNKEYTPEQIHFCLYTFIDKKLSWNETLDRYNKLFPSDQNRGTAGLQGVMYRENKVFPCTDKDGNLIYNPTTERFETSSFPIRSQGDKIGLLDRYPDAAIGYSWVDDADKERIWDIGMRQKKQRMQARQRQRAMDSLPSPLSSPGAQT